VNTVAQSEGVSKVTLDEFLSGFFPKQDEVIHVRTFQAKGATKGFTFPQNWDSSREELLTEESQKLLTELNKKNGIYFIVNSGGNKDSEITRYNAFFVESDNDTLEEQHTKLDAATIRTSARVETLKSVHAYYFVDGECTEADWRDIQQRLIAHFDGDVKNKNPSRCMRLPGWKHVTYLGTDELSYKPVEIVQFDSTRRYTVAQMLEAFPPVRNEKEQRPTKEYLDAPSSSGSKFYSWDELNDELKRRVKEKAKRNSRGNYEMRCLVHSGKTETSLFYSPETGAVKCLDGCSHEDVLRAFGLPERPSLIGVNFGGGKLKMGGTVIVQEKAEAIELLTHTPATDVGNAECLSVLYNSVMRYCHTRKSWLLWDGVRWSTDACGKAQKLTVDMVRARQQAAMEAEDFQTRKRVAEWGLSSENITRVDAALKLARVIDPFATTIDRYDANPLLATAANGTLDLRGGTYRQSDPEDYLTMQLGTAYEPEAKAPRWEQFLDEVFGGDTELIRYMQRAVGYSLTGETKEEVLFLCYGSGANGKSKFLDVLTHLLGDYAGAASFETFNAGNRNEAGYDLAVLKGKRAVTVIETNEDRYLDEAKVKAVTGQDVISCRFLYGNFFTYRPQFKIWMAMNHKPVIRGTDNGIWRRVHLIPFTQTFKGREDRDLITKLLVELPGILNWALEGLRQWQQLGLGMPEAVKNATEEYRHESDSIGQWIEERTRENPLGLLRASEGYSDYSAWTLERGERPFGQKKWKQSLVERGYKDSRNNKGVHYFGLELSNPSYR
jgi:P4 family phage/plasmid primase-like protien